MVVAPEEQMRAWPVDAVVAFLVGRDLAGPAELMRCSGVNGEDLLSLDVDTLVREIRTTSFAAKKILRARDAFLHS